MIKRSNKLSLIESFKLGFDQYLRETTVHGFRYLVEGRNICEIGVWNIVISFCFLLTFFGIYSSIKGSYDNPILTSVQTTQIQNVGENYAVKFEVLFNLIIIMRKFKALKQYFSTHTGPISSCDCTGCRRFESMGICNQKLRFH